MFVTKFLAVEFEVTLYNSVDLKILKFGNQKSIIDRPTCIFCILPIGTIGIMNVSYLNLFNLGFSSIGITSDGLSGVSLNFRFIGMFSNGFVRQILRYGFCWQQVSWIMNLWCCIRRRRLYNLKKHSVYNLKKHSVTKIFSDLSLFKQIVLVISKFLQILNRQPPITNFFLDCQNNFSHTRS